MPTALRRLSPRSCGLWEKEPGLVTSTTSSSCTEGHLLFLRLLSLRSVYREKCNSKGVEVFTSKAIQASPFLRELEDEWANMLAHQLPALPPFSALWEELPRLYTWLEGLAQVRGLPPIPHTEEIDDSWSPPSVLSVWGQRVPVEEVRFAAANHLCVELGYQDRNHLIEPYSLRMTRSGQLTLYAVQSGHRRGSFLRC